MESKEIKKLLIDCANFIQPYDDGGNEAERLMLRLDEVLDKEQTLNVSNRDMIDYIENDAEIAMPIDVLMHKDGSHLTKKEYGKVLLKYLVKEL